MILIFFISVFVAAFPVFFIPSKAKHPWFFSLVTAMAAGLLWIATKVLAGGGESVLTLPGRIPGSMGLVIDPLSAFFIVVISLGAFSAALYSWGYLKPYRAAVPSTHFSLHLFCFVLLFASLIMVVTARDAYAFLFSWELMSVSSFVLIPFDAKRKEVRRAALSYIVMMHVGFVLLLVAFTLLSADTGSASLDSLGEYFRRHRGLPLFLLFLGGFGIKAGIFPLHSWLPEAHPAAPAHVSAFMSGVMIKTGVYGIVRVVSNMGDGFAAAGVVLLTVGMVTGLYGAFLAAIQNDMKRLLAYSSIENIGIIFTAVGAAAVGYSGGNTFMSLCALSGALLHTLNHSFFKTTLFFGAGNVYRAAHTTSLDVLGGLSRRMPITAGFFLVGVVAIAALPPLSGFVSEFLIYYGFLDTVSAASGGMITAICGIVALSLIGGVVILAFTKLYGVVFLGSPRSGLVAGAREADRLSLAGFVVPVAGIVVIGLMPSLFIRGFISLSSVISGVEYSPLLYDSFTGRLWEISLSAAILIGLTALLLVVRYAILRRRTRTTSPVWGCGYTAASHRMQYSGESFSEGLYGITTSLTRNSGTGEVVDKQEIFPTPHSFDLRHKDKITSVVSGWWVESVKGINKRAVRFNTGKVNHYVLYALVFLVLVFFLTVTGII